MTTTSTPARRRRNANVIAACAESSLHCLDAASAFFQAVARSPRESVLVDPLPLRYLAAGVESALTAARKADRECWAEEARAEEERRAASSTDRLVVEEMEGIVFDSVFGGPSDAPQEVPVPEYSAADRARDAVRDAVEEYLHPRRGTLPELELLRISDRFQVPPDEILDEAMVWKMEEALRELSQASDMPDGDVSASAECAMRAVGHLSGAVELACWDAGDPE